MIIRSYLTRCLTRSINNYRLMSTRRLNPLGIQMLSSKLHEQLFASTGEPIYSKENIKKAEEHLKKFGLGSAESEVLVDVEFDLPKLKDQNLNNHFEHIAHEQSEPYVALINELINAKMPRQPTQWTNMKGWTKYENDGQTAVSVDYPEEKIFVFDVETLVTGGNFAVLAIALSPKHWFVN